MSSIAAVSNSPVNAKPISTTNDVPIGDVNLVPPLVIESYQIMDIIAQLYNVKDYSSIDRVLNSGRVSINTQNKEGLSLLLLAVLDSNLVYIQYLLCKGANPNITDINLSTPLHTASSLGNTDSMQLLLCAGASVDSQDQEGESPSHSSIRESKVKSLQLLLKSGANVNASNDDGESLLHLASSLGELECVETLVNNGANIKCVDSEGVSPIQEAKDNGHSNVVNYLVQCVRQNFNNNNNCFDETVDQYPFRSFNDIQFGSQQQQSQQFNQV